MVRVFAVSSVVLSVAGIAVRGAITSQEPQPRQSGPAMKAYRDLEYARAGDKSLLLDVYVPRDTEKPPLVVWIHGGAWRGGSKGGVGRIHWLSEHGYAVAGINYRLSQEAVMPAQIHDCKAAVRWLRAHADQYGYDPDRIGVMGASAGGHLAALLGTSGGVDELEGDVGEHRDVSSTVQAVCDLWGPTDFLQMGGDHNKPTSPESLLIGGPIQEHAGRCARANPITYVDASDPPFLLIHGDQDQAVPINQSELLHAALKAAGVGSEFQVLEGAGHGGRGFAPQKMNAMMLAFFEKHLKSRDTSDKEPPP